LAIQLGNYLVVGDFGGDLNYNPKEMGIYEPVKVNANKDDILSWV
jgi:hypothetical protein